MDALVEDADRKPFGTVCMQHMRPGLVMHAEKGHTRPAGKQGGCNIFGVFCMGVCKYSSAWVNFHPIRTLWLPGKFQSRSRSTSLCSSPWTRAIRERNRFLASPGTILRFSTSRTRTNLRRSPEGIMASHSKRFALIPFKNR